MDGKKKEERRKEKKEHNERWKERDLINWCEREMSSLRSGEVHSFIKLFGLKKIEGNEERKEELKKRNEIKKKNIYKSDVIIFLVYCLKWK